MEDCGCSRSDASGASTISRFRLLTLAKIIESIESFASFSTLLVALQQDFAAFHAICGVLLSNLAESIRVYSGSSISALSILHRNFSSKH